MRVAVVSDTHIPATCNKVPVKLLEKIKEADLIIHAGDFTEMSVLEDFRSTARVEAVAGNMDSEQIKKELPEKKILELSCFKIGIVHGYGAPDNLISYAKGVFRKDKLDCVIYGHSHIPKIDYINDVLYFCPGSPTEKVFAPYNSFGMLEIDDKITPKIIRL